MRKNLKILIFDDEESKRNIWRDKLIQVPLIKSNIEVTIGDHEMFLKAIESLEERRKTARKSDHSADSFPIDAATQVFDETDFLIVDYDLLYLPRNTYLTGESVAYLSRCYSKCGLIIALNQFDQGRPSFDLTLRGHSESFADLNISDHFLHDLGLWTEQWNGFRPWSWPILPQAFERYESRVEELRTFLDTPIIEYFEFPEGLVSGFARSAIQFLTETEGLKEITFRKFVTQSENGLRRKDKPFSEESMARIAAARVAHWLENLILSGQDILIDAPHLISNYPSLVSGNSMEIGCWNQVVTFKPQNEIGLNHILIDKFRFKKDFWLSSPVWFWHEVRNFEDIKEVSDPWSISRPDFVFCEDTSHFFPRDEARGFVADIQSPFARRFVKQIVGIDYRPRVRFSL